MIGRKNVVTIVFFDEKLAGEDCVINEFFEDSAEREAEWIVQAMEGYIVHSDIIRGKKEKLIKSIREQDYKTFYKTIKKMADKAQKDL